MPVEVWTGQAEDFPLVFYTCPCSGQLKAKAAEPTLMQLVCRAEVSLLHPISGHILFVGREVHRCTFTLKCGAVQRAIAAAAADDSFFEGQQTPDPLSLASAPCLS